ncbi:MAG: hypothetical protein IT350_14095 [Deltaproteobacteria bacterium]|nr:hypothetical protein [Deltaproteobacteria bacterium]
MLNIFDSMRRWCVVVVVVSSCSLSGDGLMESDDDDDDSQLADNQCVEVLAQVDGTCLSDGASATICSRDDASCWANCFLVASDCAEWLDCAWSNCSEDSDDDAVDDDVSDDDDAESCEDVLDGSTQECFPGLTDEDVCDLDNADCWLGCYTHTDGCAEWADCVEDVCINGEEPPWDDDADDDDDVSPDGPEISNAYWDPDPAQDDGYGAILSVLIWDVCDPNNDLSGGEIFVWIAGTSEPALAGDVYWDDFTEGAPDAPDCDSPVEVGIAIDFTGITPFGDDICFDLEATDGAGHLSNRLEDICVFVP